MSAGQRHAAAPSARYLAASLLSHTRLPCVALALALALSQHTYYMYADDEAAKDEWIGAIGKAIVRYSRSYRPEEADDDDSSSDDDLEG